jgi:hypothetical protein
VSVLEDARLAEKVAGAQPRDLDLCAERARGDARARERGSARESARKRERERERERECEGERVAR